MKKSKTPTWLIVIIVIIVIAILMFSVGLLSPKLKNGDVNKISVEEENRLKEIERQKKLDKLKEELIKVNGEIDYVNYKIEKIKLQEIKILFWSRVVVGITIIFLDIVYYIFGKVTEPLTELLRFNSALVALYSFIAFISHGTPTKFAEYLKARISATLRNFHSTTYNESDILIQKRKFILQLTERFK